MLIQDVMTKNVITAPSHTSIGDAKQIMKKHNFRRLPVVDDGKLVGIVTEGRLDRVSPSTRAPLLWQVGYLISHTTLKDVMEKKVVTIKPEATVEQGIALAQKSRVGALVVVRKGKVVGLVTTNDFFYRIVNPILGIGEPGTRLLVAGAGDGKSAAKVLNSINKVGVDVKIIWTLTSPGAERRDMVVHLDTEDPNSVIDELQKIGYTATIRPR